MKVRKEFRLALYNHILKVERSTKRKPATITFAVTDEFAEKAIKHYLNMQRFSLAMPVFLGLQLTWDEEVEEGKEKPI